VLQGDVYGYKHALAISQYEVEDTPMRDRERVSADIHEGTKMLLVVHWRMLLCNVKSCTCGFYASIQHSVAGGILFLSRSSVCVSTCASRNVVNTIYCGVFNTFLPNLHQQCIIGQG